MTASVLKKLFLDFFVDKGHKVIPNAPLVPENDPSVLFTTAGMHPLVPFLLGESHPLGRRLCNVQRCLRTDDIDQVGDGSHHTFFEMLGNWSLGDYWKREAINFSWEFYTRVLKIDPQKISVSCFAGDDQAPKDEETAQVWRSLGIPQNRIYFLGRKENWWGPVGDTGPCGPDSEFFYDTGKPACGPKCNVACHCGKYLELGNNVFMQYDRRADGQYQALGQKNVDFGGGVERALAVLCGSPEDHYRTELFWPLIKKMEMIFGRKYTDSQQSYRIMADHLRAAVFLVNDGVLPGNKDQGYVLRRLIRRTAVKKYQLGKDYDWVNFKELVQAVIEIYHGDYFAKGAAEKIWPVLENELVRFGKTLERGLREFERAGVLTPKMAFALYQSYGFPFEITQELVNQKGQKIDQEEFKQEFKRHQQLSRQGAAVRFAGGLADHSLVVTKYHTATHLLQQALRQVLGNHVQQVGSNITDKRLRFDFKHPQALADEQISKVEQIVNQKIKQNLPVKAAVMSLTEAKKQGALAFFDSRYTDQVKVYSIGDFSKEVCAGPHVTSTGKIGTINIVKQKAVGAGRRRLYATLAHGS